MLETTRKTEQQMLEIYFVYIVQTKKFNLFLKSAERFCEASVKGEGRWLFIVYDVRIH